MPAQVSIRNMQPEGSREAVELTVITAGPEGGEERLLLKPGEERTVEVSGNSFLMVDQPE